jgi:hypothetical protein
MFDTIWTIISESFNYFGWLATALTILSSFSFFKKNLFVLHVQLIESIAFKKNVFAVHEA